MRNDPVQPREINNRPRQSEIRERARCFEIEFDQPGRVRCWVCTDQGAVRGVEAGHGGVDEDGRWVGEGV